MKCEFNPEKPLIVIGGPTASGKSGVAMRLAETFPIELVSADSAQVYRRLDIGTAKPNKAEQERVPHHLLDIVSLGDGYDAGRFVTDADQIIESIWSRGHIPVVVGGTGMWLRALLFGIVAAPAGAPEIRAALLARIEEEGSVALHEEMAEVDPEAARRVHPNDSVRIVRALEVFLSTGKTMSAFQKEHDVFNRPPRYDALQLAIVPDRALLYKRINARVDVMLAEGWIEEVEAILADGVAPESAGLDILGYRAIVRALGEPDALGCAALSEVLKRDHRRYAKSQFTWFKKQPGARYVEAPEEAFRLAHEALLSLSPTQD